MRGGISLPRGRQESSQARAAPSKGVSHWMVELQELI